ASESCVQSLVSTSIAIRCVAPGGSQTVLLVQRVTAGRATRRSLFEQVGSLSAYQRVGTEQHAKLTDQPVGHVDTETIGQAEHLLIAQVEEDLRLTGVL